MYESYIWREKYKNINNIVGHSEINFHKPLSLTNLYEIFVLYISGILLAALVLLLENLRYLSAFKKC